ARAEALRFNGALSGPGDTARYRVSLHGGHRYRIHIDGRRDRARFDLRVVRDGDVLGEKLADHHEESLHFRAPISGRYWIEVHCAAGFGEYRLRIDESD